MREELPPYPPSSSAKPAKSRIDEVFREAGEHVGKAGQCINQVIREKHLDREFEEVITYLNDKVIPEARSRSSQTLRIAIRKLTRLAEHLEHGLD